MAEFDLKEKILKDIIDKSVLVWAEFLHREIREITPRDKERLPKPIDIKNENRIDKNFHYKPVNINWKWYEWVTWNLKRSIWIEKVWTWDYIIWVKKWVTEEYAGRQEFWGTDSKWRHVPERSYLRKWLGNNQKMAILRVRKVFSSLMDNYKW